MPTTLDAELTALRQKLQGDLAYIEAAIANLDAERADLRSKLTGIGLVLGDQEPKGEYPAATIQDVPAARTRVLYQGQLRSWHQIAALADIPVGGNSAHRVIFKRRRDLHDSIAHECSYVEPVNGTV